MSSDAENQMSGSSNLPQMDGAYLPGNSWQPINELMRAIILRVVDDYNSVGEFHQDALDYLHDDDEEYVFSFRSICRHLGFDPEKTRHSIMFPKHKISTRRRAA